jgi:hypothetical protein
MFHNELQWAALLSVPCIVHNRTGGGTLHNKLLLIVYLQISQKGLDRIDYTWQALYEREIGVLLDVCDELSIGCVL